MKAKSKVVSLLAAAAITLSSAATLTLFTANAQSTAPDLTNIKEQFVTIDGAMIRSAAPYGMRFVTEIDADLYDSIVEYYGEENVTLGTKIARATTDEVKTQAYTLIETQGTAVERTRWSAEKNPSKETAEYQYTIAVDGLADEQAKFNLNKSYVALGYITITDTKTTEQPTEKTYYAGYTATGYRSPLQVALTYIEVEQAKGTFDETTAINKFILGIVDTVMANGGELKFETAEGATSLAITCAQAYTPKVTVGGNEVAVKYSVQDETVAKMENGALVGLKAGTTTLTATIDGATQDYSVSIAVEVGKGTVTPVVAGNGILQLNTNGEETTIKINGVEVPTKYSTDTFNVVDYILDNSDVTSNTDYTITVETENLVGTVTHGLRPLNNSNFLNTARNLGQNDAKNRTYFLTEDVTLAEVKGTDKGAYKESWNGNHAILNMWMNLNGRGHTVYSTVQTETVKPVLIGILHSAIYNTAFDFTIINTSTTVDYVSKALIAYTMKDSASIENCFISLDCNIEKDVRVLPEDIGKDNVIKNVVINANIVGNGKLSATYAAIGTIDNVVVIDNSGKMDTFANYPSLTANLNINAYEYSTMADFVSGNNGTKIGAKNATEAHSGKVYKNWPSVWGITGDVTLCGNDVYTTNKATVYPVVENGKLVLNTNGQLTSIYVDEELIASNVIGEFDITAYAQEKGWISTTEKTIAIKVESRGCVGEVSHTFKQETATVTADYSGFMTFDVGETMPTITINGVELTEEEYAHFATASTFDLPSFAFDYKNITATTTYTVKVENVSYVGELTYIYTALAGDNFVNMVRNAGANMRVNRTYFLTSDVNLGEITNDAVGNFEKVDGDKNTIVKDMNIHVNGRGHKITATYNTHNYVPTMFSQLWSVIYNTVFDITVAENSKPSGTTRGLIVGYMVQANAGLADCYVKVTANTADNLVLVNTNSKDGCILKNVIVNFTQSGTGTVYFANEGYGLTDCVVIDSGSKFTKAQNGNMAAYKPLIYKYASFADFLSGANGTQMKHGTNTAISTKVYGSWGKAWAFDAVNGTITLAGTTVQ